MSDNNYTQDTSLMKSQELPQPNALIPYHGPHLGQYQNLDDEIGWMLLGVVWLLVAFMAGFISGLIAICLVLWL